MKEFTNLTSLFRVLMIVGMTMLISCEEDSTDPKDTVDPVTLEDCFPTTVGSFWVYENSGVDDEGIALETYYDTVTVVENLTYAGKEAVVFRTTSSSEDEEESLDAYSYEGETLYMYFGYEGSSEIPIEIDPGWREIYSPTPEIEIVNKNIEGLSLEDLIGETELGDIPLEGTFSIKIQNKPDATYNYQGNDLATKEGNMIIGLDLTGESLIGDLTVSMTMQSYRKLANGVGLVSEVETSTTHYLVENAFGTIVDETDESSETSVLIEHEIK